MRVCEAWSAAVAELMAAGGGNEQQEAWWLLEEALKLKRWEVRQRLESDMAEAEAERYRDLVSQRASGVPLQYVMGSVDFHEIRLSVGRGVLIPRPETEELVEMALQLLEEVARPRICDVCTGSGAIALALAQARKTAQVWATDISPEALGWARRNASQLGLAQVTLLLGDLFAPLGAEKDFDLVTANPPYVSPAEYVALSPEVRDYEPRLALEAEEDGLALLRRVVDEARERLRPGGWLLMEMGESQGARLTTLLREAGYAEVSIHRDLAGHERMARGRWPGQRKGRADA